MFPKHTHILVVDDSLNLRRIIVDTLNRIGFMKVVTAEDAHEAMGVLTFHADGATPINLILSDLNMPGPSGLDFLKQVRGIERFQTLPFILVTTESEKGAVIEAAMSGVSAYVVKPFTGETLTKRLQEAWRKHHPED